MSGLDAINNDVAGRFGLGAQAEPLVREALHLVTDSPGGIAGFLDQLKSAGLANEAASWLGNPHSVGLTFQEVERVVGSTALGEIGNKLGLSEPLVGISIVC